MLKIQFDDEVDLNTIECDAEKVFDNTKFVEDATVRTLIKSIEQGEYFDDVVFTDRFGHQLYLENLSTGCKAAIGVHLNPDKTIYLVECGLNARDAIINYCNTGSVVIEDNAISIRKLNDENICVELDGYLFTDVNRLNYYINDERPFKPDLERKGIEVITYVTGD